MNTTKYAMIRLQEACAAKGPLCVGLDTDPSYIPPEVLRMYDSPADAVLAYNKALIQATGPSAACFKVQIAYYEAMGLAGLKAYAETLKAVRAAGIPVIADVKRGDIADTAKAYARAHFSGDFEADIVTLNPYMGFETLDPFLEYVGKEGKGAFVLLRTSNPGMKDIEWLKLAEGELGACPPGTCFIPGKTAGVPKNPRVLDAVGMGLSAIARRFDMPAGDGSCAPVGVVVGCTEEADAREIRDRYPELFFLIPGYGAQGGAARIAATLLDRAGGTVNSSRGILTAWKKDPLLEIRAKSGELSMDDIVESAGRAAFASRAELIGAKKSLAEAAAGKGNI
jgi:orotidine-5'-phosphate decarboxylase